MSLLISSKVKPTANFAATLAIGKPVAFEASAEERENAWVHFNYHQSSIIWINCKLHI